MYKRNPDDWGTSFIISGGLVFLMAFFNFFLMTEYPSKYNIVILEKATVLDNEERM
jgi:hypothetical protein